MPQYSRITRNPDGTSSGKADRDYWVTKRYDAMFQGEKNPVFLALCSAGQDTGHGMVVTRGANRNAFSGSGETIPSDASGSKNRNPALGDDSHAWP